MRSNETQMGPKAYKELLSSELGHTAQWHLTMLDEATRYWSMLECSFEAEDSAAYSCHRPDCLAQAAPGQASPAGMGSRTVHPALARETAEIARSSKDAAL